MKFIRLPGLAAFILIVSIMLGAWYFLVDIIVENMIESNGTKALGAKVELAKADLCLSPFGIILTELQVADPDHPMRNMVQVDRIAFLADFPGLLRGKAIFNDMTFDNIRINTPRKISGAIKKKHSRNADKEEKQGPSQPAWIKSTLSSFDVPDVNEILKREDIETLKLIESARSEIKSCEKKWKTIIEEMSDREKIKDYKKRIRAIKKSSKKGLGGILGGVTSAVKLQDEIKTDLTNIRGYKADLRADIKMLNTRLMEAKLAPGEDLKRLKKKYALSPDGLLNFSSLLFQEKIEDLISTVFAWYENLKPLIKMAKSGKTPKTEKKPLRGKGVDIAFRLISPQPDFLIRTANLSIITPVGSFKGIIKNITSQQEMTGVPATFTFSGDELKGLRSAKLDAEINRLNSSNPKDTANLAVKGYSIKEVKLSESSNFPVKLESAETDFHLKAVSVNGFIDATLNAHFRAVNIAGNTDKDSNHFSKSLTSALSEIKTFNLKGVLSGTADDYTIKLSSNIDNVLKNAVEKVAGKETAHLAKELKKAISEKIKLPLSELQVNITGLDILERKLSSCMGELSGLLF